MLPASLAADVPVFIATPTSAWASAGASLVPSPVIATSRPPSCSFLISASLSSGVASARKSSTPASSAMALAVSGLSPVIITVRMPIRRISSNRSRMPCLTTSLRWMTPSTRAGCRRRSRRPPAACRRRRRCRPPGGRPRRWGGRRGRGPTSSPRSPRPCAPARPSQVDAGHPGLRGERHPLGVGQLAGLAARAGRTRCLASTTIERPSGVSSARLDSCAASASSSSVTPATGTNSAACRLPRVMVPVLSSSRVLTSPAASTARPDMASTLRCTRRSMPAMPIADSSAPIVVGIRQTSSETSTMPVTPLPFSASESGTPGLRLGVDGQRLHGGDGDQEDDRQRGQQDVQRDLVRRLLPVGALDQGDHPVDEGLAGLLGDLDDDPVGQHLRAAGHRRAVAAGLADDRRGLAGDGRLVDRGDALDHVAVAGDDLPGLDDHEVALLELGRADDVPLGVGRLPALQPAGHGVASWPRAAWRPGPCRGPRPRPRPGWRRRRSATATPRWPRRRTTGRRSPGRW